MLYQEQSFVAYTLSGDILITIIGFFVLFVLGVPVWISLGVTAYFLLFFSDVIPIRLIGESLFAGLDVFPLIAVPLFILTGDAMVRTGLSGRLLDLAEACLGWVRSGFGSSTVLGCGFFSCITGSDAAGAAAMGRIAHSRLVDKGYPPAYAAALIASGSCTGILIPPSIGYIIIGLVLGIPVSTLFTAAIIPGIIVLLSIMIANIVVNKVTGFENSTKKFDAKVLYRAIVDGKYAISIPVLILGGIYSGVFTPTEAAGVAVVYIVTLGLIQKTITLDDIPNMLLSSVKVNGIIIPIIALSLPVAQALSLIQIPQQIVHNLTEISSDPTFIIGVMLVIFIIAGAFMEAAPNIVILGPLLLPLAIEIGMDEIHFSIFMLTTLGLGFITPPLGLNLFVLSAITGIAAMEISKYAVPFMVSMLIAAIIIVSFPSLSLFFLD
ncbi:MAG: TRAP transporter large permease [Rhodospirillales bacterium]|jgi:tripartite ATP-independent transporter DctM subunit